MAARPFAPAWAFLALLVPSSPVRAVLIDDFENGNVAVSLSRGEVVRQTGLPPSGTVGGARTLSALSNFFGEPSFFLQPTAGDDGMWITFGGRAPPAVVAEIQWGSSSAPLHANLRPPGHGTVRIVFTFSEASHPGAAFTLSLFAPGTQADALTVSGVITGHGEYSLAVDPDRIDRLLDVGSIRFALSNTSLAATNYTISNIAIVPEPATAGLLGLGLAALAGMRRTRAA